MLESQSRSRAVPLGAVPSPFACAPFGGRIALTGELDISRVPELDAALRRAETGAAVVVLDLQALEFIDSSGACLILETDRRLRRSGARLVIERASEEVDWFLGLVGLDRLLERAGAPSRGRRPTYVQSAYP